MKPFSWIWQYIKKYRLRYAFTLLLSTVIIALALVNPYIIGFIVRDVLEGGNKELLLPLLGSLVGVTFFRTILRYITNLSYEDMSQDAVFWLRKDIYNRVQEQSYSFFDSNKVGDIMARMTGDLEAIRLFIAFVIYQLYENVLCFVFAIIVMFTVSWQLALLMLVLAPVLFYFAMKQSREVKPAFSKIREQFSRLNSVCQENISGNRVVKAFTREDYEIERFTVENEEYYNSNVKAAEIWAKYLPIQDFLAGVLTFFMIVAGGLMVIWDKIELYQLIIFNGYLWAVNGPMRMIGWIINELQRFVASLDKIHAMMRINVEIKNPEEPITKDKLDGLVEFKNVSFAYDKYNKNAKILKNISFKVNPGETIGIVGPTGAGKTTLVNLISRFYDTTEGNVYLDGVDVRKWDLHTIRRDISSAAQDVFLFSDTIEGNIAYGATEVSMDAIVKAAIVADANAFIRKTEDGYDTIVGERGVGLSGGQRQRLSLARAIATDPAILVLDDTTSAVDMETEHEIQSALKEHYSDRTKFIIAHRISSVKAADLILVLVDGEIIESGTHAELVDKKGYYYGLFINQYGDYNQSNEIRAEGVMVDGAK